MTSCELLTSSDHPHLVLAHEAGLAVAVSAALGVSAGQLGHSAHAAAHLGDQGAVGVLRFNSYLPIFDHKVDSAGFIINLTSQHSGSTHCWFSQLLQGVLAQSSSARQKPSGVVVVVGALVVVVVDFVVVMGSVVGTFVGLGVEVVQSTPFGQSHTGPSGN